MGIFNNLFTKKDNFSINKENARSIIKDSLSKNFQLAKNSGADEPLETAMEISILLFIDMIASKPSRFHDTISYRALKKDEELLRTYAFIEIHPFSYIDNKEESISLYIEYIMYLMFGVEVITKENFSILLSNIRYAYLQEDFPHLIANTSQPLWLNLIPE